MPEIIRKLASIRKITAIEPIPTANAIEVATVGGWKVVIKKNEFRVGDLAIYIEIDSILPDQPEFAFLKDKTDPTKPIHLRTVRLRGQISQGILFPLTILPPVFVNEGDDVTSKLHITKYDPPIPACLSGEMKGKFPHFIHKTDEERIQNAIEMITKYQDTIFYVTEKIDGTSSTFYWNNGEFGVCGRNWEFRENATNTHWKIAHQYDLANKLRQIGQNIAIQGEIIGEGINKNKYKMKGQDLYLFSIYFIDQNRYGNFSDLVTIAHQLGIKTVPIVENHYKLPKTVEELLQFANAASQLNPSILREGVVIRSVTEQNEPNLGGRLSFKVINNQFLIKYGE